MILERLILNRRGGSMFAFLAATLLGAFLVFQVQPVISKCVLPWFGGTPAVWTTCMLFFQVLLFGGYLYAHAIRTWCSPALQGSIHLCLLTAATLMLPIQPGADWRPTGGEEPTMALLTLLAAHVALPYFVLSSTGPLVQAWLSYRMTDRSVYRLYALSNVGSLAALMSYPFIVEPFFSVDQQSKFWSLAFCVFVLLMGWIATTLITRPTDSPAGMSQLAEPQITGAPQPENAQSGIPQSGAPHPENAESIAEPTSWDRVAWVALPALASMMLLIVTSHVCQDIAVIPFLWVLPLAIYLVSFILSFDSTRWYRPKIIALTTTLALVASQSGETMPPSMAMPIVALAFLLVLAGVCWICHGETARRRPATRHLTHFYAMVSLGGALGGLTIAIVCPIIFQDYRELPIGIAVSMALSVVVFLTTTHYRSTHSDRTLSPRMSTVIAGLVLVVATIMTLSERDDTIDQRRNFFGVLRVERQGEQLRLVHGNTIHGIQLAGDRRRTATSYYGIQSGIGKTITALQSKKPQMRIGVVGLGCGVLATYGRPADHWDMYEINPDVVAVAKESFSFLSDCPSSVAHFLGDGRLLLEDHVDQRYDLLVLDAFSSDAIPAHLLTLEAMELYQSRLRDDGVLAIHVSNNHLNLVPLVHRLADSVDRHSRLVQSDADVKTATRAAKWIVIGGAESDLWKHPDLRSAKPPTADEQKNAPLWTDQHHNLASVLNWFQ